MKIKIYVVFLLLVSGCDTHSYISKNQQTNELTTTALVVKNGIAYLSESEDKFTGKFVMYDYSDGSCVSESISIASDAAKIQIIESDGLKGSKLNVQYEKPICIEENYSNGIRNGLTTTWSKDFKETYAYKEGKLNGTKKLFCIINSEEKICGETTYKDGVKSGLSKSYGEGQKQTSIFIYTGSISEDEIAVATKNLTSSYDAIEEITWYKDKSIINHYGSGISAYLGKVKGGLITFRFKLEYIADSWLFIDSFIVAADDQRFEYNHIEFKRYNNSSGITEWYDKQFLDEDLVMIKAILRSKQATIRFKGNNAYEDHIISRQEKERLEDVLVAYDLLGGVVIDDTSIN
ncbi:MAG: hypothetical protein EPN17_03955 [Methylobacter sp.]|nr:MAG: hypothetical protein EPN17_03955 [Methylobacter sp.]